MRFNDLCSQQKIGSKGWVPMTLLLYQCRAFINLCLQYTLTVSLACNCHLTVLVHYACLWQTYSSKLVQLAATVGVKCTQIICQHQISNALTENWWKDFFKSCQSTFPKQKAYLNLHEAQILCSWNVPSALGDFKNTFTDCKDPAQQQA